MASTGDTWRLGRRPALDGLRTVAVALVLAVHVGIPGAENAGAVGVAVFFTLSGFLITSILLSEHARTGRVRLVEFYRRRAVRLMPAMLALVVVAVLIGLTTSAGLDWSAVLGTLTYTANFVRMCVTDGSPILGHTWSLAIEEQFYLVFPLPLLALVRWPKRRVMLALAVASFASLLLRVALWDGSLSTAVRIYSGPDTRADGLLIGCLLAVFMHGRRERKPARGLALGGLAAILLTTQASWAATMVLSPLVVSLATCAVIYEAANGGARFLAWSPLVYIGRRSYGLYLWHPPALVLAGLWFGDTLAVKLIVGLPLALGTMWLSWRYVEQPFLRASSTSRPRVESRPAASVAAGRSAQPTTWQARPRAGTGGRAAPEVP